MAVDLWGVECLKSPSGRIVKTSGKKLADALRADGWVDTDPPPKPKRSRSTKKGYYYTDSSFRHGY